MKFDIQRLERDELFLQLISSDSENLGKSLGKMQNNTQVQQHLLKKIDWLFYFNSILNFFEWGTAWIVVSNFGFLQFIIAYLPMVWAVIALWNELLPLLSHIQQLSRSRSDSGLLMRSKVIIFSIIPALIRLLLISAVLANLAYPFGLNLFLGINTFQYLLLIAVFCNLVRSSSLFLEKYVQNGDQILMFVRNIFLSISILLLVLYPAKIGLIVSLFFLVLTFLSNCLARYAFKNLDWKRSKLVKSDSIRNQIFSKLSSGTDGNIAYVKILLEDLIRRKAHLFWDSSEQAKRRVGDLCLSGGRNAKK